LASRFSFEGRFDRLSSGRELQLSLMVLTTVVWVAGGVAKKSAMVADAMATRLRDSRDMPNFQRVTA
jgi:hypothetical protein